MGRRERGEENIRRTDDNEGDVAYEFAEAGIVHVFYEEMQYGFE